MLERFFDEGSGIEVDSPLLYDQLLLATALSLTLTQTTESGKPYTLHDAVVDQIAQFLNNHPEQIDQLFASMDIRASIRPEELMHQVSFTDLVSTYQPESYRNFVKTMQMNILAEVIFQDIDAYGTDHLRDLYYSRMDAEESYVTSRKRKTL